MDFLFNVPLLEGEDVWRPGQYLFLQKPILEDDFNDTRGPVQYMSTLKIEFSHLIDPHMSFWLALLDQEMLKMIPSMFLLEHGVLFLRAHNPVICLRIEQFVVQLHLESTFYPIIRMSLTEDMILTEDIDDMNRLEDGMRDDEMTGLIDFD